MTAATAPVPAAAAASPARATLTRALGVLGMLGAPAFLGIWGQLSNATAWPNWLMLGYIVGWICSAVGLRRLRATGRGRGAVVVTVIQLVGLALAGGQNVQDLAGHRPLGPVFYTITDFAWPVSHVFMLVVGTAVLRAGVLTGWRRWTPLACGLVLPLTLLAAATKAVNPGYIFNLGTAAAFLALGLAVATTRE